MYFLLAGVAERFSLLKYGLAVILIFIGIKMLLIDLFHIPIAISLGVVAGILAVTLLVNIWVNRRAGAATAPLFRSCRTAFMPYGNPPRR